MRKRKNGRSEDVPVPAPSLSHRSAATAAPLAEPLTPLGDGVLVVSGLPRSGTSMLMQMLAAGGMPILSDLQREADEDNPNGYFEFEEVRTILSSEEGAKSWIGQAKGKAVKIVAPLVCGVPAGPQYRVILLERDFDEIWASQAKMIARRGEEVKDSPERQERLRREYWRMLEQTRTVLRSRPNVAVLSLRHDEVLRDPAGAAHQVCLFAGGKLDIARMAASVDPSLHRNRRRAAQHSA